MMFNHYFDKGDGLIKRFIYLKRNNRCIEYRYEIVMDCYNCLSIFSTKIQTEFPIFRNKRWKKRQTKDYKCYTKEFEEWENRKT